MARKIQQVVAIGAVAGLAVAALFGFQQPKAPAAGQKAPEFTLASSKGGKVSLASLRKNGSVFLYFIKPGCPVNHDAIPFYNRIYSAHKNKANFVGVISTDKAGYDKWQKEYKAPYPVLLDPDKKVIKQMGAQRSPWVIEVKKDGSIGKVWKGYSVAMLKELNADLVRGGGAKGAKVDISKAPANSTFG